MSSPITPQNCDRWRVAYAEAVAEPKVTDRLNRIAEARNAIHDRAEDLLTRGSTEESRALGRALRSLDLMEEMMAYEGKAA